MGKKKCCMFLLAAFLLLQFSSVVKAAEPSKLYFSSADGKLYYNKATTGLNYFLNLEDMYPGQTYIEELDIANEANKTYNLYFQMQPKDFFPEKLEFLSQINLKIFYEDMVLYEGTAESIFPTKSNVNVKEEMVSLGRYIPQQAKKLKVEVKLNKEYWDIDKTVTHYYTVDDNGEYTIESDTKPTGGKYQIISKSIGNYNSQIAETTWRFYAEEDVVGEKTINPILPVPKTGDDRSDRVLIVLIVIMSIMIIVIASRRDKKKIP